MEFYTFVQSEPTLAILPWLIAIGVAIIASTTTCGPPPGVDISISLGILGMVGSGKTQLLRTLQNIPYTTYAATSVDDYPSFTAKINGKSLKFRQGRDIGGDERFIPLYYEDFITKKDIVFFIFDVKRYLFDAHYAQDVRKRLDYVHRIQTKHAISNIGQRYFVIASHTDQLSTSRQKTALKELQNTVSGKSYERLFHSNLLLCDLTDRTNFFKNLSERFE